MESSDEYLSKRRCRREQKRTLPSRLASLFFPDEGQDRCLPKKMRCIHQRPYIYEYDDFLSISELNYLDEIITSNNTSFEHSFTEDDDHEQVISNHRTSSYLFLTKGQDKSIRTLEQRAADLLGLHTHNLEPIQIVKYTKDQKFDVHHDAGTLINGTDNYENHEQINESSIQVELVQPLRLVTIFIYLNDLPVGMGETHFPLLNLSITPKRNKAVIFCNVLKDLKADVRVLHQAKPVINASFRDDIPLVKYGVNMWLCDSDLSLLADLPIKYKAHASVISKIQSTKNEQVVREQNSSALSEAQARTETFISLMNFPHSINEEINISSNSDSQYWYDARDVNKDEIGDDENYWREE